MLWMKWYQTVFFFVLYNIALSHANSIYDYRYFIPIYFSLIITFFYFSFIYDQAENKQKQVEYIDDNLETTENKALNK